MRTSFQQISRSCGKQLESMITHNYWNGFKTLSRGCHYTCFKISVLTLCSQSLGATEQVSLQLSIKHSSQSVLCLKEYTDITAHDLWWVLRASHMPWSQCRWLCYPDVVVAMAREDMQCFKRYVKQGREGVGMLFPGIRIRVDQDEEKEVDRRGSKAPAMR